MVSEKTGTSYWFEVYYDKKESSNVKPNSDCIVRTLSCLDSLCYIAERDSTSKKVLDKRSDDVSRLGKLGILGQPILVQLVS